VNIVANSRAPHELCCAVAFDVYVLNCTILQNVLNSSLRCIINFRLRVPAPHRITGTLRLLSQHDTHCEASLLIDACRRGNEAFAAKDYAEAAAFYTQAISHNSEGRAGAVYHVNRAACAAAARFWAASETDARTSIAIDPSYIKGHYRLAQALLEQNKPKEAAAASIAGLGHDATSRDLLSLLQKAQDVMCGTQEPAADTSPTAAAAAARTAAAPRAAATAAAPRAPAAAARAKPATAATASRNNAAGKGLSGVSLYPDKEGSAAAAAGSGSSEDGEREVRSMLRKLKASVENHGSTVDMGSLRAPAAEGDLTATGVDPSDKHILDGVFAQLLQKDSFQGTVFPGLSEDQKQWAPQTFRELLEDPAYAGELTATARKAQVRRRSEYLYSKHSVSFVMVVRACACL
jgi:tetratricopeptide (TPR) repeat protein